MWHARRQVLGGHAVSGWARRYLVAEVAGYAGAVLPALAVASGGRVVVAVAATAGEAVAFYGVFAIVQLARRAAPRRGAWWRRLGRVLRRLGAEFGPAGAVNTVVVRPVSIYLALTLLHGVVAGVIAGKLVADIVFLGVSALSYEVAARRHPAWRTATPEPEPAPDPTDASQASGAAEAPEPVGSEIRDQGTTDTPHPADAIEAPEPLRSEIRDQGATDTSQPADAIEAPEPLRSEIRDQGTAERPTIAGQEIDAGQ